MIPGITGIGSAARQMRAALAEAPDGALGRIVHVLDALQDRGGADHLLADVRHRLRRLRPDRPLRFARLLALPLEGALVAPVAWSRAPAEIPRHALVPLAAAVRAALGTEAEAVEAAALGRTTGDAALIGQLGPRLWHRAGAAPLPDPPEGWMAAGLPREAAAPVLALCGALWRHGAALWEARMAAPEGPPEPLLRATLGAILPEGPAALLAAATLLLRHAAAPGRVSLVAGSLAPPVASLAERALGEVVAGHAAAVAAARTVAEMADCAAVLVHCLEDLEAPEPPFGREARRRQAAELRRGVAEACRARLATALRTDLLEPAAEAAARPHAEDAVVERLEAVARDLRRLQGAGRRLGQDTAFDRAVAEAVPHLLALGRQPRGLGRVEVARLVEILAGPEAALPLLA
jgi:hypothetical protein